MSAWHLRAAVRKRVADFSDEPTPCYARGVRVDIISFAAVVNESVECRRSSVPKDPRTLLDSSWLHKPQEVMKVSGGIVHCFDIANNVINLLDQVSGYTPKMHFSARKSHKT